MIRRFACAAWSRAVGAPCLLLPSACAEPYPLPETGEQALGSWLTHCASEGDCAAGSDCLAGVCTLRCGVDSLALCTALNDEGVCDTTLSACVVPCGVSTTCQALGAGYVCEQGRCRAALEPGRFD